MAEARDIIAKPPYRYDRRCQAVFGTNEKIGGAATVCDVRGWGYLTGEGHGALGLPKDEAMRIQDSVGKEIARLLNLMADGYRILAPGQIDPETIEAAAKSVECMLPEQGAGDPQDGTDRLIDGVRREDARAIRALAREA